MRVNRDFVGVHRDAATRDGMNSTNLQIQITCGEGASGVWLTKSDS